MSGIQFVQQVYRSVLVNEVEISRERMCISHFHLWSLSRLHWSNKSLSPALCHGHAGKRHALPWKTSAALDARKTHLHKLTSPDIGFQNLPSLWANHKIRMTHVLQGHFRVPGAKTPTRFTDLHIITDSYQSDIKVNINLLC